MNYAAAPNVLQKWDLILHRQLLHRHYVHFINAHIQILLDCRGLPRIKKY